MKADRPNFPGQAADPSNTFRSMTMSRALRAAVERAPHKIAVQHGAAVCSYRELMARVEALTAAAITGLKLRKGDTVAVVSLNSITYLELVCGLPEAGVAVATVNPRLTAREISEICDDAAARVVFFDDAAAEAVSKASFRTVERRLHLGPEYEALIRAPASPEAFPEVFEWEPWTLPYTSGTTGRAKGVVLSHRSRLLAFFQQALEYGCYSPEDRFLATTPMNHGAGLAFPMASIMSGGFTEIVDKFDPELLLHKLHNDGFSGAFTVPSQHYSIFQLPQPVLDQHRGMRLKALISNAAPLAQPLKEQIVDYFGDGLLHETYGSTEGGFVTNLRPAYQLEKPSCVGTPFPYTLVKLADEAFDEVAPGEVGELWTSSPTICSGYWNNQSETQIAFRQGWVSAGDLARRDEDGFVYIVDRKKDMILSGGVNVYPREIEDVLATHPQVAETAVVGVADERWGERIRAFVVARPGAGLTAEELSGFCQGRLAAFKIPKDFAFLTDLPRNANRKVLKTELRNIVISDHPATTSGMQDRGPPASAPGAADASSMVTD